MPTYEITAPDGTTYEVTAPEGATEDEILAFAQQNMQQSKGGAWNLLAGPELALSAASSAIAEPLGGLAGVGALMQGKGMDVASQAVEDARSTLTYQPRTELAQGGQEFLAKTIGKFGEWADTTGESAGQATTPAVGAAVNTAMNALPMMIPGGQRAFQAGRGAGIVTKAREMGFTLEPTQVVGGQRVGNVGQQAAAASGKYATTSNASIANQPVTNRLVAQEIGAPNPRMITKADIQNLRNQANATYTKVKSTNARLNVQGDAQYQQAIRGAIDNAGDAFTGTGPSKAVLTELQSLLDPGGAQTVRTALGKVEQLRRDARVVLNKSDDPQALALARSRRQAADALEDAVGRALQSNPGLLAEYQAARQQLAKLHNVEDAWSAGGNIDAVKLSKLREKGAPLTGALNDIADIADNFPHVMKSGATQGRTANMGAIDWALAAPTLGIWPAVKMTAQEFAPVKPFSPQQTLASALMKGEVVGSQVSAAEAERRRMMQEGLRR